MPVITTISYNLTLLLNLTIISLVLAILPKKIMLRSMFLKDSSFFSRFANYFLICIAVLLVKLVIIDLVWWLYTNYL